MLPTETLVGPAGVCLLAIAGAERWAGAGPCLGADMFWEHVGTATCVRCLGEAGLAPVRDRLIPEWTAGTASDPGPPKARRSLAS